MAYNVIRNGARTIASWINQSNKYVEDMNLFTVAMGKYAQEAQNYAEKVGELLGIDPADWMRNQGVFMTITKGFGVASDRAYTMSKNLTQLGYDLSSFYNISVEDAMTKLQSGIAGELEPLRRLGYDLSVARLQEEALALGIKKKVSKMTQAEKSQLRYYAIMTQVTQAQGDMARTIQAPANQLRVLKAQVTQLARALGNIFIPALNAVLPYLIAITKVARTLVDAIAKLVGFKLPEVDYSGLSDTTDATEALGESADETKDKLKKLKRSIMGFDELNLLTKQKDSSSDDSALSDALSGIKLPEYDFLAGLVESKIENIVQMIKDALWEIEAVISGFLLAIGTILVVSGANIPLGIALMAIGAAGLVAAIVVNWNSMTTRLAQVLTTVTAILGGFLLAIGAFLALSGANVPLGIALMAIGAASLVASVVLNWKFLENNISNVLSLITAIVGGALLGLGAVLAFTGANVPLGIALMAAGALAITTSIALAWDGMPNAIKNVLITIEAILGGALLAVGAVLAFSMGNVPLGIALMAIGALSLASVAALNWESLVGNVQQVLNILTMVLSAAMLALGAVLAFSGIDIPLGIALMVAGAVGLAAGIALQWNLVSDQIKSVCEIIEMVVGGAALALGAIMTFSGGNIPLGIALMVLGAGSLVAAIVPRWDSIVTSITTVLKNIGIALGASLLALGAVLAFSGVAMPLGIALMAVGAASLAAGVALNWNTVVNKVTDVLKKIGIAAGAALLALGVILAATGVALPLGIALIAAGAVSLAAGVALNWNTVVEKVKSFFTTVARLFTGVALIALGLLLCGTLVGLPLGIGLIKAGASALTKPESFNVESLVKIGKDAVDGVKKGVSEAWTKFKEFWENCFKGIVDWVKNFFGMAGSAVSTLFENIGKGLVAGFKSGISGIGSAISEAFGAVSQWASNFGQNLYNWGSDMMGNMVNGINSGLQTLRNKVSEAANAIRSFLHFSQPDEGPLADFNTWMPDMMSQLAGGIADNEGLVKKQMQNLANDMNLEPSLQANVSAYGAKAPTASGGDSNSGLATAIYNAVSSAMSGNGENEDSGTPIIINLGNEQIASFLVKQNKRVALVSGGRV